MNHNLSHLNKNSNHFYLIDDDCIYLGSNTNGDQSTLQNLYIPKWQDLNQNQQNEALSTAKLFEVNNSVEQHFVINAKNIKEHGQLVKIAIRDLLDVWQSEQVNAVFKSLQVLRWLLDHSFCSRCGHKTREHPKELAMLCDACGYRQYPRLQPCVIVAITQTIETEMGQKKQIFLAKDKRFKKDFHSVVAGFVEVGETLEQAVQREVFEETALQIKNIEYLGSQPWPFPSNLMIAYKAEYAGGEINLDETELVSGGFYDVNDLPNIPARGSISFAMIEHVCKNTPFEI